MPQYDLSTKTPQCWGGCLFVLVAVGGLIWHAAVLATVAAERQQGEKPGSGKRLGGGGDYSGDEALPSISPLRYKAGGAALKQQLELPPI